MLLDKGAFLAAQAPCPERPLLPSTTWSLPSPSQLEAACPPLIGAAWCSQVSLPYLDRLDLGWLPRQGEWLEDGEGPSCGLPGPSGDSGMSFCLAQGPKLSSFVL